MPRFHVTAKGDPGLCEATVQECPLKEEDGSPTPHGEFKDAKEARAFAEKVTAQRYGGSFGEPVPAKKVAPKPVAAPPKDELGVPSPKTARAMKQIKTNPQTVEEAREIWSDLRAKAYRDDFGRPRFYPVGNDPLEDMAARNFAANDVESASHAIEALRHGYGANSRRSKEFVAQLGSSSKPEVRALVAEAVEWDRDLVGKFSQDPDKGVRLALAGEMGRLTAKLESDTEIKDRVYVVPDSSAETQEARRKLAAASTRLAKDPELEVRKALAMKASWMDEAHTVLAKDSDVGIRTTVAARMTEMASKVQADSGTGDWDLFQGHTRQNPRYISKQNLSDVSQTLAEDADPRVRLTLARSQFWMDDKTARKLAKDPDEAVRKTLAYGAKSSELHPG